MHTENLYMCRVLISVCVFPHWRLWKVSWVPAVDNEEMETASTSLLVCADAPGKVAAAAASFPNAAAYVYELLTELVNRGEECRFVSKSFRCLSANCEMLWVPISLLFCTGKRSIGLK